MSTDPSSVDSKGGEHPLVIFTPSGKRGRFPVGTPVLECARTLGVDLDSVCGGRGICGRCQIVHSIGEFSKHGITSHGDNLSAPNAVEERYRSKRSMDAQRRLGCNTFINGDCVIDIPPDSQIHRQIIRKRAEARDIIMHPAMRLYYVEVEEPDMHQPQGDCERLLEALQTQWELNVLDECDLQVLHSLQQALRQGQWKVTVAIHRERVLCAVWPGLKTAIYGIAFDIGSTTIAGHLCNLTSGEVLASSGLMNPQIRFGEDLMSRVSYVMLNAGGDVEMTREVRNGINGLIRELADDAGIAVEDIMNATFVGNPIMHHLLLGINPVELGGAPFALATSSNMTHWASELDLVMNSCARIYVLPCIAGHVGADTAAVILSESPHLCDEITLIVDVGTNAEIVLGNKDGLLVASSPTGPAFEGAQITDGQRAAPGAIERVRIDPDTLEPTYRVIGCDLWSNEAAFAEETATIGVSGICGSGIIEVIAQMFLSGIITPDGIIRGDLASRTARIEADGRTFRYIITDHSSGNKTISITQNDIRAIQLAKAALYAGARLLMDKRGINTVERIVLAGAFGSHIDPLYAMVLGMIPDCPLDKISSAGNAAGTGARIALLNQEARDEIEQVVRRVEKVETAVEPQFQEHFVQAMAFPHKTAPSPHLSRAVTLPEREPADPSDTPKSSRRRRRRSS